MRNKDISLEYLNALAPNTMAEVLGIEFIEIGEDFLVAKMPVNNHSRQPLGLLHGGASVALAETIGSVAGLCYLDPQKQYCVGLEINANHIKSVKDGFVYAKASPLHIGSKTQVWDIKISTEEGKLVCVSRLTLAVIDRK